MARQLKIELEAADGIVQNLVGIAISSEVITVAPFVVIMLVLIFRPRGLFGGKVAIKKV